MLKITLVISKLLSIILLMCLSYIIIEVLRISLYLFVDINSFKSDLITEIGIFNVFIYLVVFISCITYLIILFINYKWYGEKKRLFIQLILMIALFITYFIHGNNLGIAADENYTSQRYLNENLYILISCVIVSISSIISYLSIYNKIYNK